jgi:hypothetical protein
LRLFASVMKFLQGEKQTSERARGLILAPMSAPCGPVFTHAAGNIATLAIRAFFAVACVITISQLLVYCATLTTRRDAAHSV